MIKSRSLRAVRNLCCVSVAAFALHACATGPATVLTADDLLTAPYMQSGGAPFDVDAMFASLPGWVAVEHGGARFDPALGAMVVSDLRFALRVAPDAGLAVDNAVIWGADPAAMEAVFSGAASLTAMTPMFDRMMFEGVRSQGVQWDTGAESASLSFDKIVIDGLAARSFALAPKPDVNEGASALRQMAAMIGSFAYDAAAYSGFSMRLNNSQGDNIEFKIGEAFARGYEAGATEYQSVRDVYALIEGISGNPLVEVSGQQKQEEEQNAYAKILNKPPAEAVNDIIRRPAAFLAEATGGAATEYEIAFSETRGMDVSGAFAWLARWELPPITETELLDFGAQTMLGYRQIMNGTPVYTVDRIDTAASDFYWFVPSDVSVVYAGMTYDLGAIFGEMRDGMGPGFATEAAPQFDEILNIISALGIDRLSGDMQTGWRWDGVTGDANLSMGADFTDLAGLDFRISLGGPSLARWDQMAREETPVAEAGGEISLQGLQYGLTDNGLMDRAFAYAAEQNGAGSGAELRQSMVAVARLSGAQMSGADPRIPGYAMAAADFLEFGGTLTLRAMPASPVSLLALQAAAQSSPQSLPELLNVTITHTE